MSHGFDYLKGNPANCRNRYRRCIVSLRWHIGGSPGGTKYRSPPRKWLGMCDKKPIPAGATQSLHDHEPSYRPPHRIYWMRTGSVSKDGPLASCGTMVLQQISPRPAGSENIEMITVTPVATTKV